MISSVSPILFFEQLFSVFNDCVFNAIQSISAGFGWVLFGKFKRVIVLTAFLVVICAIKG